MRPPAAHLNDFEAHRKNKGSTHDYTNTTIQRVRAVLAGCNFDRVDQVSASRVQQFLADLRANGLNGDGKRSVSIASSNHYQRAIKMFSRWLLFDHRTNEDRLVHLSKMNADLDRRRVRRPLSGVFLALQRRSVGSVLFQPVEVFQEQQPGSLLVVVEFGRAAGFVPEYVVDVLERLLEHGIAKRDI